MVHIEAIGIIILALVVAVGGHCLVRMMLRSIGMIDRYELEKNYNRGLSEYKIFNTASNILIYNGSVTLMEYWIIGGGD